MANAPTVDVVEVGPRDGLQNDAVAFTVEQRLEFVRRVAAAGIRRAEVASFVNPSRVPTMADAEVVANEACALLASPIGLVLNRRGWDRAATTGLPEINLVVVCTDTFAQRNQGMSTDDTVRVVEGVVPLATAAGVRTSVTLAASFGCPFEGEVPVARIAELAGRCAATGVTEIALADTIGVAVPADVKRRVSAVRETVGPDVALRAHFHNTRNTGYANAWAAVETGVTSLDASLGGIGGCPFAPKATGNIATEDLVFLLARSGVSTGVDLDRLLEASRWLSEQLGRPVPSLLSRSGLFPAA